LSGIDRSAHNDFAFEIFGPNDGQSQRLFATGRSRKVHGSVNNPMIRTIGHSVIVSDLSLPINAAFSESENVRAPRENAVQ